MVTQPLDLELTRAFEDVDGDGIVVILGGKNDDDWNNSDLLFFGLSSLTALVKVRSNVLVSNGSVRRCGNGPPILFDLGGEGNGVFGGSNAVLSNIALWELQDGVSDAQWGPSYQLPELPRLCSIHCR